MVFKHNEKIEYPVICRTIPNTNFEWKNYEVSGTLIKPEGSEYDDIEVGIVLLCIVVAI